ncbi:MAG TPA: zinc ABC transporter substrate-binding protein [Caldithrix abyssi]|uniref:Zinc ABC transporter substrate-binding protein n=1 Tax=Caldithrix abyssi TaxID=187145 RepID=A0A7V5H5T8_CALAY|nr:zinc ABC transporter substrate-binding protein [Caldithrix abyssi]
MKSFKYIFFLLLITAQMVLANNKLNVVTTLSTYADIAKKIGGEFVDVKYIVEGNQDAHFVRPKPSFAVLLNKADVFVSTGLDLELWAPTLVDMSKNPKIRSGQIGYVAASYGIDLLEKPAVISRSEGGVHIYGNPHIITGPLNFKKIAENIAVGLQKNDPAHAEYFKQNLIEFKRQIDEHMFGKQLVRLMGGDLLTKLTLNGKLIDFLQNKSFKGQKLIYYLGGWMKEAQIFRGKKIVAYHKNWAYFRQTFGLDIIGYVEPKPGIPPSPKHVEELVQQMRKNKVKVVLAANYFSEQKVKEICDKVGAIPVIVPMGVGGVSGTDDVFKLVDYWVSHLKEAFLSVNGE